MVRPEGILVSYEKAETSLKRISKLDERAGEIWLPQYKDEIVKAKGRMKTEKLIHPKEYKGIRLKEI